LIFSTLLLTGLAYQAHAAADTWLPESCLITPRDQFAGGVIGGKIYVVGGNMNGKSYEDDYNLKSTEVLDPLTRLWDFRAYNENNGGFGVEELTGCVLNGKLYVFGAYGTHGPTYQSMHFKFCEEYDPTTNTWTSKTPMPTTRSSATAVGYNEEIYLFGGTNGDSELDVVEAYNPLTNGWRSVTNMPVAMESVAVAVVHGQAYVFGWDKLVRVYNFTTNTWTTAGETPTRRAFSYASAAPVVDGKIYLIGGIEVESEQSYWLSDKVEIYDTATGHWSQGPSLPRPTGGHLCVVVDDSIYVIGGTIHFSYYQPSDHDLVTAACWRLPLSEQPTCDVNGDHKMSLKEAIYVLQVIAGQK